MVKTCHGCHGRSDDYEENKLKLCAGCRRVYYCSTACQRDDWVEHIFDCKPRRPITTADHLARAVYQDLLPEHFQTLQDYGFHRASTGDEKQNLFGLYVGLIKILGVPPKTVHNWRVRGVLVDEIKAAFYKIPENHRGQYFPWFLQNEHVIALAGQPLPVEKMRNDVDAMMVRAWRFVGGSEKDTPEEISAAIRHCPEEERDCHYMYALLLANSHPPPILDLFVDFGFISCNSVTEMWLGVRYEKLIADCTFKEFCEAYRAGRLLDLFESKGLQRGDRLLQDLLQARPGCKKSVWYLKQFILQEDTMEEEPRMRRAVAVDYGFINCKNDSERRELKRVYKAFFDKHDGDPLALHEAAIKGNIHGYLSDVVQGLRDPKFRRLMKNPYPLPDL